MQSVWEKFTKHGFVSSMANGTLPVENFKQYLVQDYLYLVRCIVVKVITSCLLTRPYQVHFARSNALAAYKAKTMASISAVGLYTGAHHVCPQQLIRLVLSQSSQIVLHIERETALHLDYCASFGLTKEEMERTPEHLGA